MIKDHELSDEQGKKLLVLLDRKQKVSEADFDAGLRELGVNKSVLSPAGAPPEVEKMLEDFSTSGMDNIVYDPSIVRGFAYYTGLVFEVFDTHKDNNRALFGGGRYDNLLSLFGAEPVPAVGFGMGDVTAHDFLEAHNLLPRYAPATELMIAIIEPEASSHAIKLAQDLRREDVTVAINFSGKRVGDQIRQADKMKIPFVIAVGTNERESGRYIVKNLATGAEITLPADRISAHLFSSLG